jgi:putative addiction module killer protein
VQVRRTEEFASWLSGLRDKQGRAKILARIDRLEDGNPGKTRSVGTGVVEMKIDFGPG